MLRLLCNSCWVRCPACTTAAATARCVVGHTQAMHAPHDTKHRHHQLGSLGCSQSRFPCALPPLSCQAALVVHAVVGNSSSPGDPGGCTSATLTWPPAHQPGPTLSQRWDHERGAAERLCKSAALQQLLPSERRPSAHPPHPETSQLDSSERQGGSQGQAQEQAQGQAQRQVLDRQLDHAWTQLLLDSGLEHPGSYHVLVLPPSGETVSDNPAAHERGARLMVGQHRSAFLWTAGHVGGAQAVVQAVQAAAPSLAYAFTQASSECRPSLDHNRGCAVAHYTLRMAATGKLPRLACH